MRLTRVSIPMVMFTVSLSVSGNAAPGNMVANPSFEAGDEMPAGWVPWQPDGTRTSRDTSVARSGGASARIDSDATGAREYPVLRWYVRDVRPNEIYAGSAWALNGGMTDIGAYVVIEHWAGERRLSFAQGEFATGQSDEWQRVTVRTMVGDETDAISFSLVAHGAGTVWFDDAVLVREAEGTAESGARVVEAVVDAGAVLCRHFHGFGNHGDYFLTREINTSRGVDEADRKLVLARVAAMRPHIMRTFFDYKWWEPEEGRQTPDSEAMQDYGGWLRFLQETGTSVLLTPWGDYFAYSDWMRDGTAKLPLPEKREAMVRSLAELVEYLRRDQGLSNVRYLCLMNEPDNGGPTRPTAVKEYVRLNRLLDAALRERGLREAVMLLGADDCSSGVLETGQWYRDVLAGGVECYDGMSVHSYRHAYAPSLIPWFRDSVGRLRSAEERGRRPVLITEFGYGGETFENWENHKYEYGLWMAEFATTALNEGASAVVNWCLMDTYYDETHRQKYGLWRYKDEGWGPRPGFYSWSLVNRYTRPGSRVVEVNVEPEAPRLKAVALLSPAGELTVLLVNRYDRPMTVKLLPQLRRDTEFGVHRYSQETVPTPDHGMIPASDTLRCERGSRVRLRVQPQSFVLLTELD